MKFKLIGIFILFATVACGQPTKKQNNNIPKNKMANKTENKMKIEIWSDIMCPFCYIGKRKFEAALEQFSDKKNIEIVWKSYQLMPELKSQGNKNLNQFLADEKGISLEQAESMNERATQMAKQVGLIYNLDKAIPVNTFNAHRFIHFANKYGKQHDAGEILFRSYFTDGKNVNDFTTLIELGKEIGLDEIALKTALENNSCADEVYTDIYEAQQVGVRGVPFFVFNRKYAVSGAQESQVFLQTLEKSFYEWRKENPEVKLEIIEGETCTPEGKCD